MFAKLIDTPLTELDCILTVTTPVGKRVIYRTYYPNCLVKLGEVNLPANLIVLEMHDFDVILGMDWLEAYCATMDCFSKTITFRLKGKHVELMIQGNKKRNQTGFISTLKASRLVQSGCKAFIVFIWRINNLKGWRISPLCVNFQTFFQKKSQDCHQLERLSSQLSFYQEQL